MKEAVKVDDMRDFLTLPAVLSFLLTLDRVQLSDCILRPPLNTPLELDTARMKTFNRHTNNGEGVLFQSPTIAAASLLSLRYCMYLEQIGILVPTKRFSTGEVYKPTSTDEL